MPPQPPSIHKVAHPESDPLKPASCLRPLWLRRSRHMGRASAGVFVVWGRPRVLGGAPLRGTRGPGALGPSLGLQSTSGFPGDQEGPSW